MNWRRSLLPLLIVAVSVAGCGKKADPQPPMPRRAAAIRDLEAWQDGTRVVLRASFPQVTVAGDSLGQPDALEVWRAETSRPPGDTWFSEAARLVDRLEGDMLRRIIRGDRLVWSELLPADRLDPDQARSWQVYALLVDVSGELSEPSNPAAVMPQPLAMAPEIADVRLTEDAVELVVLPRDEPLGAWSAAGSLVYRRRPGEPVSLDPIGEIGSAEVRFVDRSPAPGCFLYSVAARLDVAPGRGPRGSEVEVEVVDVFPPPTPEAPELFREPNRVRLLWSPVRSSDFAGYQVERRRGGCGDDGWEQVSGLLEDPLFADSALGPEDRVCYRISSVDLQGNVSAPSPAVGVGPF